MSPLSDAGKVWLAGGGLKRPWTYGELAAELRRPRVNAPPVAVADVLTDLTRTCWNGETFEPQDPDFAGEGVAGPERPAIGSDPALPEPGSERSAGLVRDAEIVLQTSGSTGVPRCVRHSLGNLARGVVVAPRHADDVWGLAFNPTHVAGVQVYLQAIANRNTMVNLWGVPAAEVCARCRAWGVTHLSATPTFYRLLLAVPGALPVLRSIALGGEAADAHLLAQLSERFPRARLHHIYASTEAGTLLTAEGVDFSIPDATAAVVRIDAGRLWVHRSRLGRFDGATEWYDTGDAVEITRTEPLRFRITGRVHAWINVGGEKVNPTDVEAVLCAHPGVALARVSGRRNSVMGEIIAAEVVLRGEPVSEADLRAALAQQLPAYKIPRIIRFVEKPEVTRTGKLRRDA